MIQIKRRYILIPYFLGNIAMLLFWFVMFFIISMYALSHGDASFLELLPYIAGPFILVLFSWFVFFKLFQSKKGWYIGIAITAILNMAYVPVLLDLNPFKITFFYIINILYIIAFMQAYKHRQHFNN